MNPACRSRPCVLRSEAVLNASGQTSQVSMLWSSFLCNKRSIALEKVSIHKAPDPRVSKVQIYFLFLLRDPADCDALVELKVKWSVPTGRSESESDSSMVLRLSLFRFAASSPTATLPTFVLGCWVPRPVCCCVSSPLDLSEGRLESLVRIFSWVLVVGGSTLLVSGFAYWSCWWILLELVQVVSFESTVRPTFDGSRL